MSVFPRTFPRRAEVYDVDFDPARGSEQAGRRPAVIISNDVQNQHSSIVIVAALTSSQVEKRARFPVNVLVPAGELPYDSVILTSQVLTVSKDRLLNYRGVLDAGQVAALTRALALTFGLKLPPADAMDGS